MVAKSFTYLCLWLITIALGEVSKSQVIDNSSHCGTYLFSTSVVNHFERRQDNGTLWRLANIPYSLISGVYLMRAPGLTALPLPIWFSPGRTLGSGQAATRWRASRMCNSTVVWTSNYLPSRASQYVFFRLEYLTLSFFGLGNLDMVADLVGNGGCGHCIRSLHVIYLRRKQCQWDHNMARELQCCSTVGDV